MKKFTHRLNFSEKIPKEPLFGNNKQQTHYFFQPILFSSQLTKTKIAVNEERVFVGRKCVPVVLRMDKNNTNNSFGTSERESTTRFNEY